MRRPLSLRAGLSLYAGLVLAAVLAVYSAVLYSTLAGFLRSAEERRLSSLADRVAAVAEWRPAGERFQEHEGEPPSKIPLYIDPEDLDADFNDQEAFLARAGEFSILHVPDKSWPKEILGGGDFARAGRSWSGTKAHRHLKQEESGKAPPPLELMLAVDVSDDRRALSSLAWILGLLGPILALAGAAGVRVAVGKGLAPLERLSSELKGPSGDSLSTRVALPGTGDELEALARALNGSLSRLEQVLSRERAFLADASHELRSPLAALLTTLEVALSRDRSAQEYKTELEALVPTVERMRSLTEGLLTLAKADAGRLIRGRENVDLGALLAGSLESFRFLAADRKVKLAAAPDPGPLVRGDSGLLRQALDNLVSNAILYNVEGGRVEYSFSEGVSGCTLRISDTGPGIGPEHLPQLFERFYRVDPGRSRSKGGAGLGLSIARGIAKIHGGDIRVESRVGKGTSFFLSLGSEAQIG